MKKNKHKPKKNKHKSHRNSSSGGGGGAGSAPRPASRPRNRRRGPQKGPTPDGWDAAALVAGGLGGSLLGGYAAREGYDARFVGAGLAAAGGLTAWRYGGRMRPFAAGVAAAGAGSSLLEWLDNDENAKTKKEAAVKDGGKLALTDGSTDKAPAVAEGRPSNARHGGDGLDRAFNRVRDRLQRIYDDDGDRVVDDDAT